MAKVTELEELGRRIRTLRRERQMSQEDVAEPEYTAAYISHVENGKRRPSHEALTHIASRLGMTLEQLVSGRDPDEDLRLEVETQLAIDSVRSGGAEAALTTLREVLARASETGNRVVAERAELGVGLALYRTGRVEESLGAYSRAAERVDSGPPERRTSALVGQARCLFQMGQTTDAIHMLESHLIDLENNRTADPGCLVEVYAALIPPYFEAGLIDRAKRIASKGWALAPDVPNPEQRACLYVNRAQLMLMEGEPREALTSLALAEDLYRHLGWYGEAVKLSLAKSLVLVEQDELDQAEVLVRSAITDAAASVSKPDQAQGLALLAQIRRLQGAPDEGLEIAEEAAKVAGRTVPVAAAEALREAGLCASAMDDQEAALEYWKKSLKKFKGVGHHEEVAKTAELIGDRLTAMGDSKGAAFAYKEGLGSVRRLR